MGFSAKFCGDGVKMSMGQVRRFVAATESVPDDAWVWAQVIGLEGKMTTGWTTLQGLEVRT